MVLGFRVKGLGQHAWGVSPPLTGTGLEVWVKNLWMVIMGDGFEVCGLGLGPGVQDLGFRVMGLGCGV